MSEETDDLDLELERQLIRERSLPWSVWIALGGGLGGAGLSFSINGLDYVHLAAGAVALLFGPIGLLVSLRRPRHRLGIAASIGAFASGAWLALTSGAGLNLLGASDDDVRAVLERELRVRDVRLTPVGEHTYRFVGRRDGDDCEGTILFEGSSRSNRYDATYRCGLPSDLAGLRARCDQGRADACVRAISQMRDSEPPDWAGIVALATAACPRIAPVTCFDLGVAQEFGYGGIAASLPLAAGSYDRACEAGSSTACFNLGLMLFNGRGVMADRPQAVVAWRRACDGGSVSACTALAECYRDGNGVPQEGARALSLFAAQCERDYARACNDHGFMLHQGELVPPDRAAAFASFQRGCEGDNPDACNNLGLYHRGGLVPGTNAAEAAGFFRRACELGHEGACREAGAPPP